MVRDHLLITTKHFENCHKYQIFGVGKASVNQLALVNPEDNIFFLNKDENKIFGCYKVDGEAFYNEELIWEEKNGVDAYPYRIKLRTVEMLSVDINRFSQMAEEKELRIDSGDIGQKSIFTFVPKDFGILKEELEKYGTKEKYDINDRLLHELNITTELAKEKGFSESFLEYFLVKDFYRLFDGEYIIHNQFTINLLGSKIDVLALSEEKIMVFELKRDSIGEADLKQLNNYVTWVENNKTLLERFFRVQVKHAKIKGCVVGARKKGEVVMPQNLEFFKYNVLNNQLELESA